MPLLVRAMAAGIPAARVTPGEGPGQQIGRHGEKAEQLNLALPEVRGLRAWWLFFHIVAIMLQAKITRQVISERANRTAILESLRLRRNRYFPAWIEWRWRLRSEIADPNSPDKKYITNDGSALKIVGTDLDWVNQSFALTGSLRHTNSWTSQFVKSS